MFLHLSVSHSVHREGVSASGSGGEGICLWICGCTPPVDTPPVEMTIEVGGMHPTGQPLTSG